MTEMTSPRITEALNYATAAHAGVMRKGTAIPYISHPIAVAEIVRVAGGDEDQQIAALLHDTVEDAGGESTLRDIYIRFGPGVASIVEACSDSITQGEEPKAPWWERKVLYLDRIRQEAPPAALVTAADKLHNARSIAEDHNQLGEELWHRFSTGRQGQLWYYSELADILPERLEPLGKRAMELGTQFVNVVDTLRRSAVARVGDVAISTDLSNATLHVQLIRQELRSKNISPRSA